MKKLVMGIDVGTQGVRVLITDLQGCCMATCSTPFATLNIAQLPGHKEQNPMVWWEAATASIQDCMAQLEAKGGHPKDIAALSVDATSGTILALDEENRPISVGIMYNDSRAGQEAAEIAPHSAQLASALGYQVNASFGLPKILWLQKHLDKKVAKYVHQQDYIVGKLCGIYDVTDYSNALKSCYDLIDQKWPSFLGDLDLDQTMLPQVMAPGAVIGKVQSATARETGLSTATLVVAGATDGYASALSAGISQPGDWASIIGTTLVMKGISAPLIRDDLGRIYSHLHPQGYWLLGGAGNVGGGCLSQKFSPDQFDHYNQLATQLSPTNLASYPLSDMGERFPFVCPEAQRFLLGAPCDQATEYAAILEGVGYAERLAFEMMEQLGCAVRDQIFTAGGACKSKAWLQIRSDILGKTLKVPTHTDAVMGAALLASLATDYDTLSQASSQMVTIATTIHPSEKQGCYEDGYGKTVDELKKRGYIQ